MNASLWYVRFVRSFVRSAYQKFSKHTMKTIKQQKQEQQEHTTCRTHAAYSIRQISRNKKGMLSSNEHHLLLAMYRTTTPNDKFFRATVLSIFGSWYHNSKMCKRTSLGYFQHHHWGPFAYYQNCCASYGQGESDDN